MKIIRWLFIEPARIWTCFLVLIVCFLASDWIGYLFGLPRAAKVAHAGWALNLLGLFLVIYGVGKNLDEIFPDRSKLGARIRAWLGRFPWRRRKPKHVTGNMHAVASAATLSGVGRVTAKATGIEARISILEGRMEQAEQQIEELKQRFVSDVKALHAKIEEQQAALERAVGEVDRRLERLSIGNVDLELIGTAWIVFGLSAAAIPSTVVAIWTPIFEVLEVWTPR